MINHQRTFIPGSEWLYFKVYTGIKTADKILIENISALISTLKKKKLITKWFFIRYNDPDFHLRIRVLVDNKNNINDVIKVFHRNLNNLLKNNDIWKVQIDTYNRELERYGYDMIEEAESFFYHDSDCILQLLKTLKKYNLETSRWMFGLKLIDELLSDFDYNLGKKKNFINSISTSFKKEFNFNDKNSKQFTVKYRENKKNIEQIFAKENKNEIFTQINLIFTQRSIDLKSAISIINQKIINHKNFDLDMLLSSYIHMTLNRLFRSKNRIYELLLYDFLNMFYASEIAKSIKTYS